MLALLAGFLKAAPILNGNAMLPVPLLVIWTLFPKLRPENGDCFTDEPRVRVLLDWLIVFFLNKLLKLTLRVIAGLFCADCVLLLPVLNLLTYFHTAVKVLKI